MLKFDRYFEEPMYGIIASVDSQSDQGHLCTITFHIVLSLFLFHSYNIQLASVILLLVTRPYDGRGMDPSSGGISTTAAGASSTGASAASSTRTTTAVVAVDGTRGTHVLVITVTFSFTVRRCEQRLLRRSRRGRRSHGEGRDAVLFADLGVDDAHDVLILGSRDG